MAAEVYFAGLRARNPGQNTRTKINRLFSEAGFAERIAPRDLTAVKLHFGERGNDTYISPVYVRQVVDRIKECGGSPFLTDSNTLYIGSRSNAVDHLCTAIEHGFAYAVVGAPLVIADGITGGNRRTVGVNGNHFGEVHISGDIHDARALMVLSHFKCHDVAGFGGAIKNLAMGCAPPVGKQQQHSARPVKREGECTGCGRCEEVCPGSAIKIQGGESVIDRDRCIGCFECMTICPEHAIDMDWETEIPGFVERMVEYACGVMKGKEGKCGFYNFLTRITPDCDCVPWSDASIVPDIGILASVDPVAIDAASYSLVNTQAGHRDSCLSINHEPGADKFKGVWGNTDGYKQIRYAEEMGLGSSTYELIEIG